MSNEVVYRQKREEEDKINIGEEGKYGTQESAN